MGVLALDVSGYGVVMSADSQPVALLDGETRVLNTTGQQNRNPILIREEGGFVGLVGFVGTEKIDGIPTRDWLRAFGDKRPQETLPEYANSLAAALSKEWQEHGLSSALEVFISGVENADVRFWYVRNSQGLYDHDWTFKKPSAQFRAVDDLDQNYIAQDLHPGQTKEQLLKSRMYHFRQGVLRPAALVFDAFSLIMNSIYASGVPGFEPIDSLDDLAYFARQRIEFLKRLHSAQHGIYKQRPAPIGGKVHVFGVKVDGELREYPKQRDQARTLVLGRTNRCNFA